MCVLYTTNGWATTNVANSLFYGAKAAYILTNSSSANTVMGTYFYQSSGQNWFNNLSLISPAFPAWITIRSLASGL